MTKGPSSSGSMSAEAELHGPCPSGLPVATWLGQSPTSIDGDTRVLVPVPLLLEQLSGDMIPIRHDSPTESAQSVALRVPTGMCSSPTVKLGTLRHLRKKPPGL